MQANYFLFINVKLIFNEAKKSKVKWFLGRKTVKALNALHPSN